jgi:hypothetical protein
MAAGANMSSSSGATIPPSLLEEKLSVAAPVEPRESTPDRF